MKKDQAIFVTGCGRSGSSMIAGLLHICGAFIGEVESPDGNFENIAIRDTIVRPYLEQIRACVECQYPLPDTNHLNIPMDWNSRVSTILQQQGYERGPWVFKGSSIALLWPIWHYAFPNAKWIIVRRRTADIITSCFKTSSMKAFKLKENLNAVGAYAPSEGWLWWVHEFEKRFVDLLTSDADCRIVWPERMGYGNYQQMMDTVAWLGLTWKTEAFTFIDPKFGKFREK